MGSALLRGAERDLRGWHPQPHSARFGDLLWHDDLVAVAMVAPRLGPRLHLGFHADRDFPCAATPRLGVCPSRKSEVPRCWNVAGLPARPISPPHTLPTCLRAAFPPRLTTL